MMTHTFGRTKSSLVLKKWELVLSYSANRRSLEWDNSTAVVDLILTMSPVQSPKKDLLFGWSKSPSWEGKWQSGGVLLGILKGRVHDLIASHKIVQIETFGSRDVKRFRFFWGESILGFYSMFHCLHHVAKGIEWQNDIEWLCFTSTRCSPSKSQLIISQFDEPPAGHCYHNKAVRKTQKAWSWNHTFKISLYCLLDADLVGLMMFVWVHPKHYRSSTLCMIVYASKNFEAPLRVESLFCSWRVALNLWICSGLCSFASHLNVSRNHQQHLLVLALMLHRCDVTVLPGLQHPPLQNMWQVGSKGAEAKDS